MESGISELSSNSGLACSVHFSTNTLTLNDGLNKTIPLSFARIHVNSVASQDLLYLVLVSRRRRISRGFLPRIRNGEMTSLATLPACWFFAGLYDWQLPPYLNSLWPYRRGLEYAVYIICSGLRLPVTEPLSGEILVNSSINPTNIYFLTQQY